MKKILVALASLALVGAVNLGVASANPFAGPTPPPSPKIEKPTTPGAPQGSETDVEQEGDHQDTDTDEADMNDGEQGEHEDANAATTITGKRDQQDRNTEQEGENEGDN